MNDAAKKLELVCGNCEHLGPGPNTQKDVLSRNCYRYPPTSIGVLTPQGIVLVSARPEVRVDTPACGDFESPDEDDSADTP